MAPTLLNFVDARLPFVFVPDWSTEAVARLELGNTRNGSYSGIAGGVRAYQRHAIDLGTLIKGYRYGGELELETLSVSGESLGGYDILRVGGFAGLDGMLTAADFPMYWATDLSLSPLAFGQVGISGSKKSLGSFSALSLRAELVSISSTRFEWGGAVETINLSAKAGRSISQSDMRFLALLRYGF
jgi:hypothetical protein